jgi:hypothetical protein
MTISSIGAPSPASETDLLRDTERARLRALVSANIGQAQQFHAPDFQLITPIGAALSKEDYMGAIASGQLKYLTWQPADIAVRLYKGVAVLRYRAQLEVVFSRRRIPSATTGTLTPMRIGMDSGWSSGRKPQPFNNKAFAATLIRSC